MIEKDRLILVGVISAAHGIKGDVLIKSYTEPYKNILSLKLVNEKQEAMQFTKSRLHKDDLFVCSLNSCFNRNLAESLKGTKLFCFRSDLPEPLEEEYYFNDLVNLDVIDKQGDKIGVVINVANFGAGDIIEIKFTDGRKEMFPFTTDIFSEVSKNYILLNISKSN